MVDTRPSILFINRVYPPERGATGRMLRDLAKYFSRNGWQVQILTTGPRALRELDGAVKVTRVKGPEKPRMGFGYIGVWLKLLFALRRLPKADVVVSMTDPPLACGIGVVAASRMKARHVHWCQDVYPDILPALGLRLPSFAMRFFKALSMRWMKRADKVIAIGRCMGKYLSENGVPAKRISVIPNWPDMELTDGGNALTDGNRHNVPSTVESAKPYSEQIKTDQKFRILYAGNIGLAHPMQTILEATKSLNQTNPEIEFVFVGEGPRFNRISSYRAEHGLENIRLLPYQPNSRLREVMESGDVHIISMAHQATGLMVPSKLYSALSVHRPVLFVGPARTEIYKVLRDFQAGDAVEQGDVAALIDTILKYRNDGEAWFAAHEGAKKASEVFTPTDSMQAWIRLIQKLIGQENGIDDTNKGRRDYAEAA